MSLIGELTVEYDLYQQNAFDMFMYVPPSPFTSIRLIVDLKCIDIRAVIRYRHVEVDK